MLWYVYMYVYVYKWYVRLVKSTHSMQQTNSIITYIPILLIVISTCFKHFVTLFECAPHPSTAYHIIPYHTIAPPRSPGPIFNVDRAMRTQSADRKHAHLDTSGRNLYNSIYYEGFSLQSSGNYYHGIEAYLGHTSFPAAIPSVAVKLPPKHIPRSHSILNEDGEKVKKIQTSRVKQPAAVEKMRLAALKENS